MTSHAVDPMTPSRPQLEGRIAAALASTSVPPASPALPSTTPDAPIAVHTDRRVRQQSRGTTSSEVHLTTPLERTIFGHGDFHITSQIRHDLALEERQRSQQQPVQVAAPSMAAQTTRSTTVAVASEVQQAPAAAQPVAPPARVPSVRRR